MAYFMRVKSSNGRELLINIDLITRITPRNGDGAWLEFASEHQQDMIINEEDYRRMLKELEMAE